MKLAVQKSPSGKYILRYDASLIAESNCSYKVWLKLMRGLRGEGEGDFKMEYGTAFHKAMVAHYSGRPLNVVTEAAFNHYAGVYVPDTDWRTTAHLMNCVMQYVNFYKKEGDLIVPDIGPDGKPTLEISFAYPFYSSSLVDVLLCGTIDFKGMYNNYHKVIVDHKTTSLTQVESYLNGYCLSSQLMTYKMIYEMLFPGEKIACLINGVFINRTNKNVFRRSQLLEFNDLQMALHRRRVTDLIHDVVAKFERWLINVYKGGDSEKGHEWIFLPNYTCCKREYGMCEFTPICLLESQNDKESVISNNFTVSTYDPLKFQT